MTFDGEPKSMGSGKCNTFLDQKKVMSEKDRKDRCQLRGDKISAFSEASCVVLTFRSIRNMSAFSTTSFKTELHLQVSIARA